MLRKSRDSTYTLNSANSVPLVSVILVARDEEEHIEKCLTSLLSQDYPRFEVIAVDDGSTDNTLKIMRDVEKNSPKKRLKVIALDNKPDDWYGKTWASERGYLQSRGSMLLFTDADTNYTGKNTLSLTISYMQKQHLHVLTGVPYLMLCDFWSKIVMPVWNTFFLTFGASADKVNDPKTKCAHLMGSFFIIHRLIFEDVGTYSSVRNAIQEDAALGYLLKSKGYQVKMVKMDTLLSALWSRDLKTLWHGIGRTIVPMALENRMKVITNLIIIFYMTALPFILLFINLFSITNVNSRIDLYLFYHLDPLIFLNILSCLLVIIGVSAKGFIQYKMISGYSLLSFLGSIFLIIVYIYYLMPLFIVGRSKPILWKRRTYVYKRG